MRAALVLLLTTACGGWSRQDTALELGFLAATAEDWKQTRGIARNCEETNPIIGRCGERVDPDHFMPAAMLAHVLVSAILPPRWRSAWQLLGVGAEVSTAWENYQNRWWLLSADSGSQAPRAR